MEIQEKGCVYFFKHIGLSPVKIGYSTKESPVSRFEQFKTYAPYGAELVGFIPTDTAKKLETELHLRFREKRLKCEWFDISVDQVKELINFYCEIDYVNEKNKFEIEWANRVYKNSLASGFVDSKYSPIKTKYHTKKIIINLLESCELFGVDKPDMKVFYKKNMIAYRSHRIEKGKIKTGYVMWTIQDCIIT